MEKNNIKGILIVNTGSPSSLDSQSIRLYLKEFLSDKRVIHLPRLFWLPILYLFILPFRPQKMAEKELEIWLTRKFIHFFHYCKSVVFTLSFYSREKKRS